MSARLADYAAGMDVLGEAIGAMRSGRPHAALQTGRGRWGVRFRSSPGVGFHAVFAGSCWLLPPGGDPVRLAAGDLALVPHGAGYALADDPATPLSDFAAGRRTDAGDGPGTDLLCGAYLLHRRHPHPLLAGLPPVVRLATAGTPLGAVLGLLRAELADPAAGGSTATTALLDTALLYALRAWYAEEAERAEPGWAVALADGAVGAALAAVHREPARPWTVEELGAVAGLSRAAFARRFAGLVGEPPLAYLTRWRLTLAARMLRDGSAPLRVIAQRTGYASEFALAKAFKREYGTAPGRYRAEQRTGAAESSGLAAC